MSNVRSAHLEGLPGRLLEPGDDADVIIWQADNDQLKVTTEDAIAYLGEKQESPGGCRLTLQFAEGATPELAESKRVDIVRLEFHEARDALIVELREREDSGRLEARTATLKEEDVDDAIEASFPASDPPAFNPGKA